MDLLHSVILSIVQGITEFLPISSSAHLILVPHFLGEADQGVMMDVAAHGGTLLAVLLYFWRDSFRLVFGLRDALQIRNSREQQLFLKITVGALPALMVGAALYATDSSFLRSIGLIAAASFVFGLILGHADRSQSSIGFEDITWRHTFYIGFSQILAFIPGTSRSGITMTMARYLKITREAAARFSMLLSIPVISSALVMYSYKAYETGVVSIAQDFWVVFGLSFVTAVIAIHGLLKWLQNHSFMPFVVYRVALSGVLVLMFMI